MPYFGIPIRNGLSLGLGAVASLSTDFALRPSLDLIFAGADALDSQVTFSRGTNATYFDSAGVLKYAPNNLLTYSEAFNTTPNWAVTRSSITPNAAISPDGTSNADKLLDSNDPSTTHFVTQTFNFTSGTTYTVSVFAKQAEIRYVRIGFGPVAFGSIQIAFFDLQNGVVTSTAGTVTPSISDAGNGWWRISVTATATATTSDVVSINLSLNGTSSNFTGTGTDGIYIWGAQLNVGDLQPYYPTQATAYYGPRFDYNPATLAAQGLLIEEQRTNLFPASNDFSNATYWTVYGTAVATGGAAIGPDGLTSASNLAGATDITLSGNNIEDLITISASTAYEFSVFVKSNGGTTVTLRMRDSTGGSTSSAPFAVTSSWKRISISRTMAAGATSVRCIIGATDNDILIYGAQLEAGAFPTSYIPTTTTALTRAADVASVNTLSPWYNASEGTVYGEWLFPITYSTVSSAAVSIDNGTASNDIGLRTNTAHTSYAGTAVINSTSLANINSVAVGSVSANTKCAMAIAYKSGDSIMCGGGVLGSASTTAFGGGAFTTVRIGNNRVPNQPLNGYIRRITYYPRRLSDAELQAITS